MRKWGVKTVVPSNIFPVVGEFAFLWWNAMACPYYHFSRPVTNRCDKLLSIEVRVRMFKIAREPAMLGAANGSRLCLLLGKAGASLRSD
jgi:hypothetical protein